MVQSGNPGGCGTPAYIAPTAKTPEDPSVTSGASVNKYTASTIPAVTPKLNQSVRPKNRAFCKLPGSSSEVLWKASCGVGLGSGLSFIETRLPTNRHHVRSNLYGSIEAIARWRSFTRVGFLSATERLSSTVGYDQSIVAAFFRRSFSSFHVVRMMPRS